MLYTAMYRPPSFAPLLFGVAGMLADREEFAQGKQAIKAEVVVRFGGEFGTLPHRQQDVVQGVARSEVRGRSGDLGEDVDGAKSGNVDDPALYDSLTITVAEVKQCEPPY